MYLPCILTQSMCVCVIQKKKRMTCTHSRLDACLAWVLHYACCQAAAKVYFPL